MKPKHLLVITNVSAEQAEAFKEVRGVENVTYNSDTEITMLMIDAETSDSDEAFRAAMSACKVIAPEAVILAHGEILQLVMPDTPPGNPLWN